MFYKNLSMWLVIGLTMVLLFNLFNKPHSQVTEMSYSDFISSVESGKFWADSIAYLRYSYSRDILN